MDSFTISRIFNAPRNAVFHCWTASDRFEKWFAPDACETTLLHADASPGGYFLQSDKWPDGSHFHIKHTFRQVSPDEQLVFVTSFCNANGDVVKHPHASLWPVKMLTSVKFEDDGPGTKVTVVLDPVEASSEEKVFFNEIHEGCQAGWNGTFDRLERTLQEAVSDVSTV